MPIERHIRVIAYWLRRLIGVNEDLLDRVKLDRPRYTRMGAIVCLTAALSTVSMLVVTSQLATGWISALGAVAFAPAWGLVILTIDSWLISSTHGSRRARTLLPRLMLSVLLGFVIAEPMVILVFRPAIERQVTLTREEMIAAEASTWKTCNPATDEPVADHRCASHRLALPDSPSTLRTELADLRARRDNDAAALDRDKNRWEELDAATRAECAGTARPDTTGVRGEGPQCLHNREVAEQYRRDTRLEQRPADLVRLDGRINDLQNKVTEAATSYGAKVQAEIDKKQNDARTQAVGILEELDALGKLSATSTPVTVAHWILRLLLVVVDCLPVLAKWMGGPTAYDRLVMRRTESDVKLYDEELRRREEITSLVGEASKEDGLRKRRATLDEYAEDDRRTRLDLERELDEQTERLYQLYRREQP